MPAEKRSVRTWVVAGALATALGLAAVLGTAGRAPAQDDATTTTVAEGQDGTPGTTTAPDDTTEDGIDPGGRSGERCEGGSDDGTGSGTDEGTTGEETATDV